MSQLWRKMGLSYFGIWSQGRIHLKLREEGEVLFHWKITPFTPCIIWAYSLLCGCQNKIFFLRKGINLSASALPEIKHCIGKMCFLQKQHDGVGTQSLVLHFLCGCSGFFCLCRTIPEEGTSSQRMCVAGEGVSQGPGGCWSGPTLACGTKSWLQKQSLKGLVLQVLLN